jgi:SAM-dependent methyltransferase
MSYEQAPTLHPQLRELVLRGLSDTLGERSFDPDGEAVLGDGATGRRLQALAAMSFRGRRVLDLGARLGDLSRHARRQGAELIDAIDLDPERVELGRLIDVLQQVDRISWFEGDAGMASTYADEYDFIFAFGPAAEAARPILPRLVQNLRGVLLCELATDDEGPLGAALAELLPAKRALAEGDGTVVVGCATEVGVLRRHLAEGASAQSDGVR